MEPETGTNLPTNNEKIRKRSWVCSLMLTMALTYFILIFLLFLAGLIFHNDLTRALEQYYQPGEFREGAMLWFMIAGTLLYACCSSGIILFLLKRKSGFFLFFSTALVIFILDLIFLEFDLLRYLIHSGFFFIIGLMHFSKRCYR
jgi:hypothetical protein